MSHCQAHHQTMLPSATSTQLLNPFSIGDPTASLGSLFQSLASLSVKQFFLISNLNLSWCKLWPPPLVLSLGNRDWHPLCYTLLSGSWREQSFSPGWTPHSSLSCSSKNLCSKSLHQTHCWKWNKWSRNQKAPESGVKSQSLNVQEEPKAKDEGLKHQLAGEQCGLLQSLPVVRLWFPKLRLQRAVLWSLLMNPR